MIENCLSRGLPSLCPFLWSLLPVGQGLVEASCSYLSEWGARGLSSIMRQFLSASWAGMMAFWIINRPLASPFDKMLHSLAYSLTSIEGGKAFLCLVVSYLLLTKFRKEINEIICKKKSPSLSLPLSLSAFSFLYECSALLLAIYHSKWYHSQIWYYKNIFSSF